MKTYSTPLLYAAALAAALVLSQSAVRAALLVEESFNYALTDASTIHGATSTAWGTSGSWAVTNTGTNNLSVYTSTGLTFGTYATSGGALNLQSNFNATGNDNTLAAVKLNTAATGTVWSSYLANYSTMSLASGGFAQVGVSQDGGVTSHFISQVNSETPATSRKLGVGYDTTASASSNTAFATGTTYMFISKFTNVGVTLGSGVNGVATTWVLTEAQYNALVIAGFNETSLDNVSSYFKKHTETVGTGTFNFDTDGYLTLRSNAPNFNNNRVTVVFDEVKFGTDLDSVVSAVPEPSTYAMIAGVMGLAGAMFRRRRSKVA